MKGKGGTENIGEREEENLEGKKKSTWGEAETTYR